MELEIALAFVVGFMFRPAFDVFFKILDEASKR